ncbi:MAG: FAD-dependent oxidoreductase, partial [Streptosporangiaceae bacterium]
MNSQACEPEPDQPWQPDYGQPDHRRPDALVVGGGVIGLAIAWRAAQQGLRVTVADPAPGGGATHAAAGMLSPVAEAAYA